MKSKLFILWTSVACLLLGASLYVIFVLAPVEEQMGIVQKIFYFHVPSAYAMYLGFLISAIGGAGYLAKRSDRFDALSVAGTEIGLLFCFVVLTTGPLWARKAWGVWWTWDPRLTTTLLLGLIFASSMALRSFGGIGETERKMASALALLGLLDAPLVHYSVQRWRGQHPTVLTGRGGGLEGHMYTALWMSLAAFTVLVFLLVWMRFSLERMRHDVALADLGGNHAE